MAKLDKSKRTREKPIKTEKAKALDVDKAADQTLLKTAEEIDSPFLFEDDETLRQRGYYHAVSHSGRFDRALTDILNDSESVHRQWEVRTHSIFNAQLNHLEQDIAVFKRRLAQEDGFMNRLRGEADALKTRKTALRQAVEDIQKEFHDLNETLANLQKDEVHQRVQDLRKELKELVETYQETFSSKYEDQGGTEVKKRAEEERSLIDRLLKAHENSFSKLKEKVDGLYNAGVGEPSVWFLLSVGATASVAAGWFFSVFLNETNVDRENTLFFILTGLFGSLHDFIAGPPALQSFMYLGAGLLAVIGVITLVVYLAQVAINMHGRGKTDYDFSSKNLGEDMESLIKISAPNVFSFWLQVMPLVLIAGLVFILVAIGKGGGEMAELGRWMSGQIIGTSLALIMAGAAFLYIVKVIEPRSESQSEAKKPSGKRLLRLYLELVALVSASVLLIAFLIAGSEVISGLKGFDVLTALLGFLVTANLTAFTIGYGFRHRSMLHNLTQLENRLSHLVNVNKALASGKPYGFFIQERDQFNHGYLLAQKRIMELMIGQINRFDQTRNEWEIVNPVYRLRHFLRLSLGFLRPSQKPALTDHQKEAYPEHRYKFEWLESRLKLKQEELKEVQEQLDTLSTEKSEAMKEALKRAKKIEIDIQDKQRRLEQLQVRLRSSLEHIHTRSDRSKMRLQDGFYLARWYLHTRIDGLEVTQKPLNLLPPA